MTGYMQQQEYSERELLTSLQRLASQAPNAPFVYLQNDAPATGSSSQNDQPIPFVAVSYEEAHRIVCSLALVWQKRLAEDYSIDWTNSQQPVTVTLLTLPTQHSFFHLFALWAIGVTVQYVDHCLGQGTVSRLIHGARSDLVLHSGLDASTASWLDSLTTKHAIPSLELPCEEHALRLTHLVKNGSLAQPAFRTEQPFQLYSRIPEPSIISHSSASTGEPKLIPYSMRYWCFDIARHASEVLAQNLQQTSAARPRLLIARPFYNTFVGFIVLHLISARPLALLQPRNGFAPTAVEVLDALVQTNAGEVATYVEQGRQMILLARDHPNKGWMEALLGLDQFAISGSGVDVHLSSLVEQNSIRALNIFGVSEVGGMLVGPGPPTAPLHVLFANPSQHHHLFLPVHDHVQLWSLVSAWPRLQHVLEYRPRLKPGQQLPRVIQAEPYPGPGPHHGQPSVNWKDLFRVTESSKKNTEGSKTPRGYVHLGREGDVLRHSNASGTNAIEVESCLLQNLRQRLGFNKVSQVQVFGANLPGVAAAIVLHDDAQTKVKDDGVQIHKAAVQEAIEATASELSLPPYSVPQSLDFVKVMQDTEDPALLTTHKGNLRRSINTRRFEPWLASLPWHKSHL